MGQQNWQLCPYRKVLKGDAHCALAVKDGSAESESDLVDVETCQKCSVPDWLEVHPCANLSIGKYLTATQYSGGVMINDYSTTVDCKANLPKFQTDLSFCTPECPSYNPMTLPIDPGAIPKLFDPQELKTDADIRQAILATLYKFHSEHPKRFGKFDVTPVYIMKAVGIDEDTLARVILPMEDNDEIKLLRREGDLFFQGATITSKGIEHIDSNPLFRRLNTETIRAASTYNVQVSGLGNTIAVGEGAIAKSISLSNNKDLQEHFNQLLGIIKQLEEGPVKTEALKYVEIATMEIAKPEPEVSMVQAALKRIKNDLLPTAANVATVVQLILQVLSSLSK